MCPACIATAAWAVAGLTATGGLSALVATKLRTKAGAGHDEPAHNSKGDANEAQ